MAQQAMYPALANSPGTEITTELTSAAVTISVLDATKLPAAPNLLTIGTDDNPETVLYTGKSGNNLTGCTRGFNGTTAQSWIVGSKVARYFTAYDHDAFRSNIMEVSDEVETARTGAGPDYIGYDTLSERLEAERAELVSQIDAANAQLAETMTVVNAKLRFGAVGDGITDDTSTLQAALDYVFGIGGGIVFLPPGVYVVNQLRVGSNVQVWGAGASVTTVKQKNVASGDASVFVNKNFALGDANIVIRDLSIDGNKANQTNTPDYHYGVYLGNVSGVLIDNVEFKGMSGDGVFLGYSWSFGNTADIPCKNVTIRKCKISGCTRNQIAILYADGVLIDDCWIQGASSSALIDIENHHNNDYIKNVTVQNSRLDNETGGQKVKCLTNGFAAANDNIKFVGNTFNRTGIAVQQMSKVDIINNKFIISSGVGVELIAASDTLVDGNYIIGASIGIYGYEYLGAVPNSLQIARNRIRGCINQGVYLSKVTNSQVIGNQITNNGAQGIYLEGACTNVIVDSNVSTDTRSSGKTQTYAIHLENQNTSIVVSNNFFRGNLTSIVDGSSTFDPTKILWNNNDDSYLSTTTTGSKITTTTFGYTMVWQNEVILANAAGGAFTMTLPSAVTAKGKVLTIKKIDSGSFAVTVNSAAGTIDGVASKSLTTQWQTLRVISDGANWFTLN